ncbi:FxSxx-COOH system tetratricopeptide repeat protein [Streptomyces longisporus]|uniref:FxSxx-COOH system tetratricopeptide repeat protein n=1 Tax=Streptomyces longisporus TaxID=1948 RepID=A0ABN3MCB1_STRLO
MTHEPSPARDGQTVHGRDGPRPPSGEEPRPLTRLHPSEVADAVWVASEHAWLTGVPVPSAHDRLPEGAEDTGRDLSPLHPDDALDPALPTPDLHGAQTVPEPAIDATAWSAGSEPVPSALPDHATSVDTEETAGRPSHRLPRVPGSMPADGPAARRSTGARALGRALRAFRTAVASAHGRELDEEATAERIALAPSLPPVLRPTPERRWRAVLLVDTAPHMAVWREHIARFAKVAHRFGGFRDITELSLNALSADRAAISLPGPIRETRPVSARGLVDPTGRSVIFVLTDGSAPAWRSGAAQRLLALWGRRQPVAVLHVLPQRLWHRTGLHPSGVRLRASGPWAADRTPQWEPAEALSDVLRPRALPQATVPVPVLEMDAGWLEPWARFVGGAEPREIELAAVLTTVLERPRSPLPGPSADPAQRVAAFHGWASPEAFQLATHMAAVQLDLPTMTEVQRRTMPRTGPEHMAEFLLSGLVSPLLWYAHDQLSFVFEPGVREELLAYGSRDATATAIEQAAELLAPRSAAARDLLSYLRGDGGKAARAHGTDREFREVERAVLHALSGPHARRARALDSLEPEPGLAIGSPERTGFAPSSAAPSLTESPQSVHDDSSPSATPASGGLADPGEGDTPVSTVPAASERGQEPSLTAGGSRASELKVAGNIPPRNLMFTGREELLVALERGLRSGPTAVLPHALHGMGGVGKSQLALEYVYRHATEYDLVWWIPAELTTEIQRSLVELARKMNLRVTPEANTAVPAVLEALRTGNPYRKWLLVFDNAESPGAVQGYFPSAPEGGPAGSVIVTSRNPQWNTLAHPLEVDVFTRPESVQLLHRRNSELTDEEAGMLAEVLGDLPLAVEQASAWLAETGMPAAEYLRVFEEKRAELMAVSAPPQYEETVATAWNVSLDHVEKKYAGALQLLQLCSYFAPEPISRQFFSIAVAESIAPELDLIFTDPMRLSRAIREISRYSLAKINYRTNAIQMHRLVQAVLVARMSVEQRERFQHGAHLLLAANTPSNPRDPQNWPRFGQLYPHVISSQASKSSNRNVRQMVHNVAEYLYHWGDHAAALEFTSQVYKEWCEKFGEDDPATLALGQRLRWVLWRVGRYPEAADLDERMLATLDPAGPGTEEPYLVVKGLVASDRRVSGDFRGALEYDEDVYQHAVRAFGDDDPTTITHAFNLAVCLRVHGEYRRALELDDNVWRLRTEMFGADSTQALISQASVALDQQELGEYTLALRMCTENAEQTEALLGEPHLETYRSKARLGVAQRKAGLHAEAAKNTSIALAALTERYGERAPDVLQISLNYSIDLRQTGRLQEARDRCRRTRDLYKETLGEDHPQTISAEADLAVTLRQMDQVDAARKLNESVLTRFRQALGEKHPNTLATAVNLANDLFAQGDSTAAHALDEQTLEQVREKLGETHPTTLVLRVNLAIDLRALGRREEAELLHAEAVEGIKEKLGEAHPAYHDALKWRRANCDIDPMYL